MINNCPFDVTPYSQSNNITTPNIFNLNYTNQDYWSMKSRLIDFTKQNFDKDFSDFVESSLGLMLIENWAFLADTLSFKMDQIANEVFIDTVTETENAFRLAKLVGFNPQPPIAASSLWSGTITNILTTDLEIPTPVSLEVGAGSGKGNIEIEIFPADANNNPIFDENIIIPAGSLVNASLIGIEGVSRSQTYIATGAVGQSISLAEFPVIYDSVRVYVDGVLWNQVSYFTDSQPRREYRLEFDSEYKGYIVFGNNRAGLIPQSGSLATVEYRVGGGIIGNLVNNAMKKQIIANSKGLLFPIPVSFSNYTKLQYGYDGDTIEDIRDKLPKWIRAQQRAVTGLDYKTISDQFVTPYQGKIGKSTAVLRNYGCSGNIVDIYVLALDGQDHLVEASEELKLELNNRINELKMFTDFICIKNGVVVEVDVVIDIVINRFYKKFENELRVKIEQRLNQFFSLVNWEFKQDLRSSNISTSLSDLKEITRTEINLITNSDSNSGAHVTTKFYEIIRPDTIQISFTYE